MTERLPIAGRVLAGDVDVRKAIMPGPLSKVRVLMYGTDEPLLRIRAKVLSTIACDTQVFQIEQEAADAMAANQSQPSLVILCHSADDAGAERLRNLALKAGVPTYTVERLVPPNQLIEDVNRVLKRGKGSHKAARACP